MPSSVTLVLLPTAAKRPESVGALACRARAAALSRSSAGAGAPRCGGKRLSHIPQAAGAKGRGRGDRADETEMAPMPARTCGTRTRGWRSALRDAACPISTGEGRGVSD